MQRQLPLPAIVVALALALTIVCVIGYRMFVGNASAAREENKINPAYVPNEKDRQTRPAGAFMPGMGSRE